MFRARSKRGALLLRVLLDDSGSADSPRVCIASGFTTVDSASQRLGIA